MEQRNRIFYLFKPLIPRAVQIFLRRKLVRHQMTQYRDVWPIDKRCGRAPEGWQGWPEGKRFAFVLTHDVDTARGQERVLALADIEERLGLRSSFNFVPLRYSVSDKVLAALRERGFEVGVHGLYHDGKYYDSRSGFLERAAKINHYLHKWDCSGYRAPGMLHKLDWFHDLNIEYDASTFDTDPFEPQPLGAGTIFPFMVSSSETKKQYVELPYTLVQDFTLFVLMQQRTTEIWEQKLDWLVQRGGMALINTHPDYMCFNGAACRSEEYPVQHYDRFLRQVQSTHSGQYWHVLPREVARFWRRTASDDQHDARALKSLHLENVSLRCKCGTSIRIPQSRRTGT
jgi:hypothetical protein